MMPKYSVGGYGQLAALRPMRDPNIDVASEIRGCRTAAPVSLAIERRRSEFKQIEQVVQRRCVQWHVRVERRCNRVGEVIRLRFVTVLNPQWRSMKFRIDTWSA